MIKLNDGTKLELDNYEVGDIYSIDYPDEKDYEYGTEIYDEICDELDKIESVGNIFDARIEDLLDKHYRRVKYVTEVYECTY